MEDSHHFNPIATFSSERDANTSVVNHATQPSSDKSRSEKIVISTESGKTIEINEQLHFYAPNSLLSHPLISPVNSYLGGLPPLLFIAGDKEVLRDEIIYWFVELNLVKKCPSFSHGLYKFSAHKAAYPDRFPITDSTRALYPSLISIEDRCKATSVHLQVYDGEILSYHAEYQ